MMEVQLSPPRTRSLTAEVAASIRAAIFSGQLGPGDPLPELHLARRLQVSQATVREALFRLQHAGLAVREPNKRTFVTRFSPAELSERIEVRGVLEELAAVKAAARMTEADLQEASRLAEDVVRLVTANSYLEASEADLNFHRFLWRKSGSKTLCQTLEQLTTPLFAYLTILRSRRPHGLDHVTPAQGHGPVLEALRRREEATIRKAVREHVATWHLLGPEFEGEPEANPASKELTPNAVRNPA